MLQKSSAHQARILTAGATTPLGEIISDPLFKEGYSDGHAGRPISNYAPLYLEGYQEGVIRAPSGLLNGKSHTQR
jgi:hypothetical protein